MPLSSWSTAVHEPPKIKKVPADVLQCAVAAADVAKARRQVVAALAEAHRTVLLWPEIDAVAIQYEVETAAEAMRTLSTALTEQAAAVLWAAEMLAGCCSSSRLSETGVASIEALCRHPDLI